MTKQAWHEHMRQAGPHDTSEAGGCPECNKRRKTKRSNARARWREDALRSCGLVKVRGSVSGRTYWE